MQPCAQVLVQRHLARIDIEAVTKRAPKGLETGFVTGVLPSRQQGDPVLTDCSTPDRCGTGKAYLIYFDPSDYPNLSDPDTPDVIDLSRVGNGLADEIPGVVFTGVNLGDRAGFSVAAGGRIDPNVSSRDWKNGRRFEPPVQ